MNNEPLADFGVAVRFYKDNIERTFIFHNCSRKRKEEIVIVLRQLAQIIETDINDNGEKVKEINIKLRKDYNKYKTQK